jgi:hypothetical protein
MVSAIRSWLLRWTSYRRDSPARSAADGTVAEIGFNEGADVLGRRLEIPDPDRIAGFVASPCQGQLHCRRPPAITHVWPHTLP